MKVNILGKNSIYYEIDKNILTLRHDIKSESKLEINLKDAQKRNFVRILITEDSEYNLYRGSQGECKVAEILINPLKSYYIMKNCHKETEDINIDFNDDDVTLTLYTKFV